MNILIKLLVIVSLLLAPFSGSAASAMPTADSSNDMHAMHAMHDDSAMMANHDCCDTEQQANFSQAAHQQCDNSCGDCQHHCSSSASGLIALIQLPTQYHPLTQWPHSHGVPLSRQESQIRPPMSA